MLSFGSCSRIESWFKLALKEIYDHGIWSFISQGLSWWPLTPSTQYSFNSVLRLCATSRGNPQDGCGEKEGCSGSSVRSTELNNNNNKATASSGPVEFKVPWQTESHILSCVYDAKWPSLGFWCLLFMSSRFSRMLLKGGVSSSSSTVGFRHYCWSLAEP